MSNIIENAAVRLINGQIANTENVTARCRSLTHRGYLSKSLVKSHDCIKKKCPFFEKLNPEYWQIIESAKQEKKNNRLKRKKEKEMMSARDMVIRKTLEDSGHIHVTSIKEESRNSLVISYIYDKEIDLANEIQSLQKKFNKKIMLQPIFASNDLIELLIRKHRHESDKVSNWCIK